MVTASAGDLVPRTTSSTSLVECLTAIQNAGRSRSALVWNSLISSCLSSQFSVTLHRENILPCCVGQYITFLMEYSWDAWGCAAQALGPFCLACKIMRKSTLSNENSTAYPPSTTIAQFLTAMYCSESTQVMWIYRACLMGEEIYFMRRCWCCDESHRRRLRS